MCTEWYATLVQILPCEKSLRHHLVELILKEFTFDFLMLFFHLSFSNTSSTVIDFGGKRIMRKVIFLFKFRVLKNDF